MANELFRYMENNSHLEREILSQPYTADGATEDAIFNIFNSIKNSGVPDLRQVATNINYGFNAAHQSLIQTPNKFDKGFVFFTRPQLCLNDEALLRDPRLYSFLSTDPKSVHRYVRCLLDPRLGYASPGKEKVGSSPEARAVGELFGSPGTIKSEMLDNENPYMTILTNCLKTLSGWPDPSAGFYVTEPNVGGGQTVYVDKHNRERGVFSLSATFQNPPGNALVLALWLWREVQALTWEGILDPYPDFIVNNQFNYKTAIYRFVMDEHRKRIILPMKTIATLDAPDIGRLADYNYEAGKVREDTDLNVNFKCEGVDYFNPYILIEFNLAMGIGDPAFARLITYDIVTQFRKEAAGIKRDITIQDAGLAKVPKQLIQYFNFRAKPYVNLNTLELEWYVSTECAEYKHLLTHIPIRDLFKTITKEEMEARAEMQETLNNITREESDLLTSEKKTQQGIVDKTKEDLQTNVKEFISKNAEYKTDKAAKEEAERITRQNASNLIAIEIREKHIKKLEQEASEVLSKQNDIQNKIVELKADGEEKNRDQILALTKELGELQNQSMQITKKLEDSKHVKEIYENKAKEAEQKADELFKKAYGDTEKDKKDPNKHENIEEATQKQHKDQQKKQEEVKAKTETARKEADEKKETAKTTAVNDVEKQQEKVEHLKDQIQQLTTDVAIAEKEREYIINNVGPGKEMMNANTNEHIAKMKLEAAEKKLKEEGYKLEQMLDAESKNKQANEQATAEKAKQESAAKEEQRKQTEAAKAEQKKQEEEAAKLEEKRKQDEAKALAQQKAEQQKADEEQKRLDDLAKAEEKKALEAANAEQKKQDELAKKAEAEAKKQEADALAKANEEAKKAEEAERAEQKKLEEEAKRVEEQQRKEAEKQKQAEEAEKKKQEAIAKAEKEKEEKAKREEAAKAEAEKQKAEKAAQEAAEAERKQQEKEKADREKAEREALKQAEAEAKKALEQANSSLTSLSGSNQAKLTNAMNIAKNANEAVDDARSNVSMVQYELRQRESEMRKAKYYAEEAAKKHGADSEAHKRAKATLELAERRAQAQRDSLNKQKALLSEAVKKQQIATENLKETKKQLNV